MIEILRHMEDQLQETISNSIFKKEAQSVYFFEASKKQSEIELTEKALEEYEQNLIISLQT